MKTIVNRVYSSDLRGVVTPQNGDVGECLFGVVHGCRLTAGSVGFNGLVLESVNHFSSPANHFSIPSD